MKNERALVLMLIPVFALAAAQTSASPGQTPSAHAAAEQSQSLQEKDQPQSDLSDAARRAREERELQRARRSAGSEAVSQMAHELSDATEQAPPAPVGYRYYNFKQGDYSILVPADAEVEERDSYGLKLLSTEAMGSRTIVILGDPIPAEGETLEEIVHNASRKYLPGCRPVANAGGPCPFDNEVLGSVRYFPRDGYVMPVICGYPYLAEDKVPNSNLPIATLVKRYDRERNGYRACDTVLPSLRFNDHGSEWHPKTLESGPKRAVITNALLNSDSTVRGGGAENAALGNVARLHKKVSSTKVLTELKHTSPGFSSYGFNYCSRRMFRCLTSDTGKGT